MRSPLNGIDITKYLNIQGNSWYSNGCAGKAHGAKGGMEFKTF
jgi:hypothetical protein